MKELEILLNKRWVLKSRDKETYYKLRDALGELRKFTTEKMGCQIIDNSLLIKMEKIPVIPESFMGIQKFSSKEEYAYLCILLMFLEDRDAQEQFIISQLTEYITANLPEEISDWTLYTNRRKLIRVMRFAADQGLIGVTDGKDEAFMDDEGGEVLYENTGASRYFMKSFSKDIMEYTKPEDFQESDWFEVDEDRGFARRHRVYKRLIFAPGMYKADGSSEDFEYLKYYGRRLSEELEQIFDCHVHIHKGSAYLLSGDDCRMGTVFPGNNSISDILLLCFREIRKKIEKGQWKTGLDETCLIDQIEFENMIKEIKQELTYNELDKSIENLWSILFTTGYLTQRERIDSRKLRLAIPNREIKELFELQIREWFQEKSSEDVKKLDKLCMAFPDGDAETIEDLFNDYLWNTISIRDTAVKGRKENFYHGVLLGLLSHMENWAVWSNIESGEGYCDILLEVPENRVGVVIEMKYAQEDRMEAACTEALKQIEQRQYAARLKSDGMKNIVNYGIACYRKHCKVKIGKENS